MKLFSRVTAALAAAAISTLALVGCDEQKIKELEEGLSTEADVRAQFGEPERVWSEEDGSRTFEYNRQPAGAKNYMITIGSDGVMTALRQVLTPHVFEQIQPGKSIAFYLNSSFALRTVLAAAFDRDLRIRTPKHRVELPRIDSQTRRTANAAVEFEHLPRRSRLRTLRRVSRRFYRQRGNISGVLMLSMTV